MPGVVTLALLVVCCVFSGAHAKRSTVECPGGCIIASVMHPRQCKCVVPKTSWRAAFGPKMSRVRRKAGTVTRPRAANLGGLDTNFCDRDAFTYSSFAECYGAAAGFLPKGPSISSAAYPVLAEARSRVVGRSFLHAQPLGGNSSDSAVLASAAVVSSSSSSSSGGNRKLLQTCPPANPCLDTSTYLRWETVVGATTAASDVTIPAGTPVVLHGCAQPGSTVSVRSITVPVGATLIIGDSPLQLNLTRMNVSGTFQMGAPTCPIQSLITVFVPGGNSTFGIFVATGAKYDVHAQTNGPTWTRVAQTVAAGATVLLLVDAVQWQPGDTIFITTTSWKDELANQNEVLTVASISADGRTVTINQPVQFNHYGGEYKAEVGLLTRRILFTSDATSKASGIGPHTMMMSPDARITGAGYERWGARNVAGHYSVHYHLAGEAANLAYVRNCAIYSANWRCITIHGTNGVVLQGNVGFDTTGHCYYLENGVEERNVIDRNLAAYVHPIQMAGSNGGQQGTDRWQSADLFDPTDAGAAGFYSLNAYNTWTNNAASGGFAGFSFPHAPRPIKEHRYLIKPDGFPFNPSERPFIQFKGNTIHSTGYAWEHAGGVYFGGMIMYKNDTTDGVIKLFYNNGRGSIQSEPLCPDPNWPVGADGASNDCWVGSSRSTKTPDFSADAFLIVEDVSVALANVAVMSWGERIEVRGLQAYDVTRGVEFLGQSWLTGGLIRINTANTVAGWSGWPFSAAENWWDSWPIKGVEWYDTMTSTLLSNVTFENYKFVRYTTDPTDWWYYQTPHAFRMLSHSDQFKPDKTMMVTKGITCNNCDLGTVQGNQSIGGAFFTVDQTYRGSSWLFNWLDLDGSVVRHVAPTKQPGPYLITSSPEWWWLDDASSWREPRFGGEYGPIIVNAMPTGEAAARLEMRVATAAGAQYTIGAFDGQDITRIGYVSQFGNTSRQVVMTKTEGTTGMTGKYGWYTVWNTTSTASYTAPKRLELVLFNVPRDKWVYWTSCWPAGTTFAVKKTFDWASCQDVIPLAAVTSRDALLASGGNNYWVDANTCLHLKLTDPGHPWQFSDSFQRDGMYIEEEIRWFDLRYVIETSMACADPFFCALPGNPANRVPAAITTQPTSCQDKPPAGDNCPNVKCNVGCTATGIASGGLCQASCNTCPVYVPPSPSPRPPSPSPSPKPPSPSPSPKPSPSPAPLPLMKLAVAAPTKAQSGTGVTAGYKCTCQVTVTSASGTKLGAVSLVGVWSATVANTTGFPSANMTASTSSNGQASFTSAVYPKQNMGCFFTVRSATKSGYVLDPAAVTTSPQLTWVS